MSDYTIVNLDDVENVAPRFQMPEGMDVRFPRRDLGCTAAASASSGSLPACVSRSGTGTPGRRRST
jgi:hypothetical protein